MADIHDELNRVLKYGRTRPKQDWTPFIESNWQARKAAGPGTSIEKATEQERGVLADFLGDEGDPREHILRKANEEGEPSMLVADKQDVSKDATRQIRMPDSSLLRASIVGHSARPGETIQPAGVRLHWFADHNDMTPSGYKFMHFHSTHSPEEAKDILSKFDPEDAPGIENLTKLIDQHFGGDSTSPDAVDHNKTKL